MGINSGLSTFLVAAGLVSSWALSAGLAHGTEGSVGESTSRCVADLARVNNDFCLSASHIAFGSSPATPLNYSWSLNDDRFDLVTKSCLSSSGIAGERQDLVLALDRSRSMWVVDGTNAKTGTVSIAAAKLMIDAVKTEAEANPERAAKIGVMLFSTDDRCEEYVGGRIDVDRVFPCLFVPAGSSADVEHVNRLHAFLSAAEGKYSQGGLDRGSDYGIVAQALRSNMLELDPVKRSGLVLLSDARTYVGRPNDIFAYLRSNSYRVAQGEALEKFAAREMRQFKLVFALATMPELFAGAIHKEEYQNMCALPDAAAADCRVPVNQTRPETWPVNTMDLRAFAEKLVATAGSAAGNVIAMTEKEKILGALDILRYGAEDLLVLESVTWTTDGNVYRPAQFVDGSIRVPAIDAVSPVTLDLLLRAGAREVSVPIKIALTRVDSSGEALASGEMMCAADGAAAPKLSLKNLQGGSASCAVVGDGSDSNNSALLFLMLTPLFLILASALTRRSGSRLAGPVLSALIAASAFGVDSNPAKADEGGLNVLQYRPVVDGHGNAEVATPLLRGAYNAGLYFDYANDALELGVEKNKRSTSVVDDLVTAHFVGNVGVAQNFSLGVHAPFVASVAIDRETGAESKEPKNSAQASDVAIFAKAKILSRPSYNLGLMPLVTAPTGKSESLTGDGSANYGLLLLVSGGDSLIAWSANVGYLQREKALEVEDTRAKTLVIRGQYLLHLGATWRATSAISMASSFQLKVSAGEVFDFTNSNPSEWGLTTNYRLNQQTVLSGTFGTGIGKGYGSPDYRVVAGIAYIPSNVRPGPPLRKQISQSGPVKR